MKIVLLCSDIHHPVYAYLEQWKSENDAQHDIQLISKTKEIATKGDLLFLISCSELIRKTTRNLFRYTLVLHASDLPEGRGWSPHIWDIVNGKDELTLSLLNANDKVDTGDIWQKRKIELNGTELFDEINDLLFSAELELISWACESIDVAEPIRQPDTSITYHEKRTPTDSEVDMSKSLVSQFNLLRVCDPKRFPAFFYHKDQKYKILIEKDDD